MGGGRSAGRDGINTSIREKERERARERSTRQGGEENRGQSAASLLTHRRSWREDERLWGKERTIEDHSSQRYTEVNETDAKQERKRQERDFVVLKRRN